MSKLTIIKYVNNNQMSKGYLKTYGRLQHRETLSARDVAKHIQRHGSVFTSDVVVGVVERFSHCIEELLQDGYKVKLDGLGTFQLSVNTTGEQDPDDFGANNVRRVFIRFDADRSKQFDWNSKAQTLRSSFVFVSPDDDDDDSSHGTSPQPGDDEGEDRP